MQAIQKNTFGSDYFFWVDFGAGHGELNFRSPWCPCTATIPGTVTLAGDQNTTRGNTEDKYFDDDLIYQHLMNTSFAHVHADAQRGGYPRRQLRWLVPRLRAARRRS